MLFRMSRPTRSAKRTRSSDGSTASANLVKRRTKEKEKEVMNPVVLVKRQEDEEELVLGWCPIRICRIPES